MGAGNYEKLSQHKNSQYLLMNAPCPSVYDSSKSLDINGLFEDFTVDNYVAVTSSFGYAYPSEYAIRPVGATVSPETISQVKNLSIAGASLLAVPTLSKLKKSPRVAERIPKKYQTLIDDRVNVIAQDTSLAPWTKESFLDSNYRTVRTTEDIKVYRVFGGSAKPGGAFVTTEPALSKIQAKIDAALLPEWKNTRQFEAEIIIPKGTVLSVGKVAPQTIVSSGTILAGNVDQVLMPLNWPKEWVQTVRLLRP